MGVLKVKTEDGFLPVGGGGSGITAAEKALILSLFRNAAYTADMSATISRLESLWSGSGDEPDAPVEPDDPVIPVYTVTNNLTGVTNSNRQTEVTEGFYSASLSWEDGYELSSIVITMGGVDITDQVYGEGSILITEVTGNIVITAVAEKPASVAMSAVFTPDSTKLYSDNGSTQLLSKNYIPGVQSLHQTETETTVTIRLTNNTESDISGTAYVGEMDEYLAKTNAAAAYNAKVGTSATIGAGRSVEFTYTLGAGQYLYGAPHRNADVSVTGAMNIHEPVAEIETATATADAWTMYSDDGSTTLESRTYIKGVYTTEVFAEDTVIRVSVPGAVSIGKSYFGCCNPSSPNTVYYAVTKFQNGSSVAEGAIAVYEYTVKAGYAFIWAGFGGAVYIERV